MTLMFFWSFPSLFSAVIKKSLNFALKFTSRGCLINMKIMRIYSWSHDNYAPKINDFYNIRRRWKLNFDFNKKTKFSFLFGKLSSFIISLRLFYSTEGMLGMLVNKTSLFISPQELFTPTSNWSVKRFVLLQDRRVKIRKFCFAKWFSIWKFI